MSGTWTVWGDESAPIAVDLNRDDAVAMVDKLLEDRGDVYAEQDGTGETYEGSE